MAGNIVEEIAEETADKVSEAKEDVSETALSASDVVQAASATAHSLAAEAEARAAETVREVKDDIEDHKDDIGWLKNQVQEINSALALQATNQQTALEALKTEILSALSTLTKQESQTQEIVAETANPQEAPETKPGVEKEAVEDRKEAENLRRKHRWI
jgi:hypothetical protein